MDWLTEAQKLTEASQPFALATVVRRVAPASAQPGAKALVLPDGSMRGWVVGRCAQPIVIAEARQALRAGKPRLLRLGKLPGATRQEDVAEHPMTCHSGGALEILIEPMLPAPRLAVVGETPVAATLAQSAEVMGYQVRRLERAAAVGSAQLAAGSPSFIVVASMGVDDEEALAAALNAGAAYVALVASPKRASVIRETLRALGVPDGPHRGRRMRPRRGKPRRRRPDVLESARARRHRPRARHVRLRCRLTGTDRAQPRPQDRPGPDRRQRRHRR